MSFILHSYCTWEMLIDAPPNIFSCMKFYSLSIAAIKNGGSHWKFWSWPSNDLEDWPSETFHGHHRIDRVRLHICSKQNLHNTKYLARYSGVPGFLGHPVYTGWRISYWPQKIKKIKNFQKNFMIRKYHLGT